MVITYGNAGYFRLQNGELVMEVDPISGRTKPDLLLRTEADSAHAIQAPGEISFPGEYEMREIEVRGLHEAQGSTAEKVKTVYLVRWDDIKLVFLGHISEVPEAAVLKEIEVAEPDIVFIPTGSRDTIPASDAAKLIRQLEPAVVIPSHFTSVDEFSKAHGKKGEAMEKFVFKKKELIAKEGKLIILQN